jgi:hypothetical protein
MTLTMGSRPGLMASRTISSCLTMTSSRRRAPATWNCPTRALRAEGQYIDHLQALVFLAHAGRVDLARALDLRTARDFTIPPNGCRPRIFSNPKRRATTLPISRRSRTPICSVTPSYASWRGNWPRQLQTVPAGKPRLRMPRSKVSHLSHSRE